MKQKYLISSYASALLATLVAIITTIFATSPNTGSRAGTVAAILGVFSIASWAVASLSKD